MEPIEADLKPLLICDLCKKVFKDPKYLPCLHTFCRSCINDDAKSRLRSEKSQTYYCPKCSRVNRFQREVTVKNLGEHLPENKLAENIVDGYNLKTGSSQCKPCDRKKTSSNGAQWCTKCKEPLCDACVDSHKSFKPTMGHEILDIKTIKSKPLKELLLPPLCDEHKDDVEFYCSNHKEAICNTCKTTTHRACKSVFTAQETLQRMREDTKALQHLVAKHEQNAKTLLENRTNEKEVLELTKKRVSSEITSIRKQVDVLLSKYETQLLKELDNIYHKEKQALDNDIEGAQGVYNSSNNIKSLLKSTSKHANEVHFIEWQSKIENEAQMLSDMIYDIHEPLTTSRMTFNVNSDLQKILKPIRNLGELAVKKDKVHLISGLEKPDEMEPTEKKPEQNDNISMLSYQLPLQHVPIRTKTDEKACHITGMIVTSSNALVCTDKNNSKIKVFSENFDLLQEHELENAPFDVTAVSHNTVAVTIPSESIIAIYSINGGLKQVSTIKTNSACYGLSYANKRYAYTCPIGREICVNMISEKGEEIMTISPEENCIPLFLRPWYVRFDRSGSHLFVSDCNRAKIYKLVGNSLRQFDYRHERLNAPRGLAVMKNDDFFVVGWGSDNVHFVNQNGEFIREVVNRWNGTFSPQTVCLTSREDRIIVSLEPTSCNSDVLLVFELSGSWF